MADLDQTKWYRIAEKDDGQSLEGTSLFLRHGTSGATYMNETDETSPKQLWQISSYNATYHTLRSQDGGGHAFMATMIGDYGDTTLRMAGGDGADESILWKIGSLNDGSHVLTNARNGSAMRLMNGSPMTLSSSDLEPQKHKFYFHEVGEVTQWEFSQVTYPAGIPNPDTTNNQDDTVRVHPGPGDNTGDMGNNQNSTITTQSDSGLSVGAQAGIGITVSIAIIALALTFFLLWRRRKRQSKLPTELEVAEDKVPIHPYYMPQQPEPAMMYPAFYEKEGYPEPAQLAAIKSPVELGTPQPWPELSAENEVRDEWEKSPPRLSRNVIYEESRWQQICATKDGLAHL